MNAMEFLVLRNKEADRTQSHLLLKLTYCYL